MRVIGFSSDMVFKLLRNSLENSICGIKSVGQAVPGSGIQKHSSQYATSACADVDGNRTLDATRKDTLNLI